MAEWHDAESARDEWVDAPLDDEQLTQLLTVAREQIVAYAPTYTPDEDFPDEIPDAFRFYQLTQARNIWNASKVDPASGGVGDESFIVRPFPLDWIIRQGLRPKRGAPSVR
jgi:hypothetical protein